MRCYEIQGEAAELKVRTPLADGFKTKKRINILEEPQPEDNVVSPWQIISLSLGP